MDNFTFSSIFHFHNEDGNFYEVIDQTFKNSEHKIETSTDVAIDISQLTQAITTLCCNASLFVIIVLCKKLRRRKSHQIFLNLLLVHTMLSISWIISNVYSSSVYITLNNGLAFEMFFSLIISTCDRFFFIKYPFRHAHLTTRKVILITAVSWIPSSLFVCFSIRYGISQFYCTLVITIMIPVATVVLALSNINIYIMAKKHDAFVRQNGTPSKASVIRDANKLRASWICFSIVLTFIVFWFPYFIHNLLAFMNVYQPDSQKSFTRAVERIAFGNSLIDPLLFAWLSRDTRKEVGEVIKRTCSAYFTRGNKVDQK